MPRVTGKNNIDVAKICFEENLRDFADSRTAPEKFNLYNGLAKMAAAIEELKADVDQIKRHLASMR